MPNRQRPRIVALGRRVGLGLVLLAAVFLATADRSRAANTITYHAGWNLVGAPDGARYAGAEGALYTLQPDDDQYEVMPAGTRAVAGYGYWVYFPLAHTVQLPEGDQFVTVQLPPGRWVSIGNPSGIRTAPVTGADALYTWDPGRGYHASASLLPGEGAWAYSQEGALLTIGLADTSAGEFEPPSGDIPPGPAGTLDAAGCRTGDVLAAVYHPSRLQVLDPCRTVTGTIARVRVETDGDYHVALAADPGYDDVLNARNLTIQKGALVIEVIPADQREVARPFVGDHIAVTGAFVLDRDHGWLEIHPAWRIAVIPR
ncbi:MAG: hypothetical protein ACYDCQ_23040 [Dehalococcoidia bacterium]